MLENEILQAFENAIKHHLKVRFQMNDTPKEKFILFHPYASLLDAFDGRSIIGLVELHHTASQTNYIARPKLIGIKHIELTSVVFVPDHQKWSDLDLYSIDVLLKA